MCWIKRMITFLMLFPLSYAFAHDDILKDIYSQIKGQYKAQQFDAITYSLTYRNTLTDDFLIQFPGQSLWGLSASEFPSYGFNKNLDPDFGLLHCTTDAECQPFGRCMQLLTFNNGLTNAETKMCIGMADANLDRIYNTIVKAQEFVDITTLEPFPDLRFKAALRNAINFLAKSGRHITIRILDGLYEPIPTAKKVNQKQLANELSLTTYSYLQDLVRDIKNIPNSNIKIYIAGMRSCSATPFSTCGKNSPSEYMALSWNHAKIIDVDGKYVLTGGVNQYTDAYLEEFPILDLMMEVKGPTASTTLGFTNMLWDFVRNNSMDSLHVIEYAFENGSIIKNHMPSTIQFTIDEGMGESEILSIGRTGGGILPNGLQENTSDLALYLMLNSATHSIYIAQQSLKAAFDTWPYDVIHGTPHTNLISAISRLLINEGDIYIVTSPFADNLIADSGGYASLTTKEELWTKIKSETSALLELSNSDKSSNSILCKHLHISNVRFSNDPEWSDGHLVYDHYKFFMIDDHIFYIGSQNFYPANLQEYGYIIDDDKAAMQLIEKFWQPLWTFSSKSEYQSLDCK